LFDEEDTLSEDTSDEADGTAEIPSDDFECRDVRGLRASRKNVYRHKGNYDDNTPGISNGYKGRRFGVCDENTAGISNGHKGHMRRANFRDFRRAQRRMIQC